MASIPVQFLVRFQHVKYEGDVPTVKPGTNHLVTLAIPESQTQPVSGVGPSGKQWGGYSVSNDDNTRTRWCKRAVDEWLLTYRGPTAVVWVRPKGHPNADWVQFEVTP